MKRIAIVVGLAMSIATTAGASVPLYPSYGNSSTLGDCGVAAAADIEQTLTHHLPSYPMVMAAYQTLSPDNNGVVTNDLFSYWQTTGIAGRTIQPPVAVHNTRRRIEQAIRVHHALLANVNVRSMTYGNLGLTIDGGSGSVVGEHSVAVVGYSSSGMKVISWGHQMMLSWAYWSKYGTGMWSIALTR